MTEIRRRDLLLAGLALPGILGAIDREAGDDSLEPKRFEDIVGFEVADVVSRYRLAILPLGSLEFHGPHNHLGSDSIIVSGIAERVAARTTGLLFPTIRFMQCRAHTAHVRGTIWVWAAVMPMYVGHVLRNLAHLAVRT